MWYSKQLGPFGFWRFQRISKPREAARSRPISGHSNGGRIPPSLQDTATEVPNEFGPGVPKHLRDLLFKVLDGQVPAADSQTAAPAAGAAGAAAGAGAQPEGPAP